MVRHTRYEIHERETGWYCPQTGRTYQSGVGALRAIRRRERREVEAVSVAVIVWCPTTRVGRAVAAALGDPAPPEKPPVFPDFP